MPTRIVRYFSAAQLTATPAAARALVLMPRPPFAPRPPPRYRPLPLPRPRTRRDRLVRHYQDFLEMLPLKMYTHPDCGPLNLAAYVPACANPTDLGPKSYIAFGRPQEHEAEGDSTTRLHQDMSDAINFNLHSHYGPGEKERIHVRCGDEPPDKET